MNRGVIENFAREYFGSAAVRHLRFVPLRGGLEAAGIARVRASAGSFVAKILPPGGLRELKVHRAVEEVVQSQIAPRILGTAIADDGRTYFFLEWIRPASRWPWTNPELAALVLAQLADIHSNAGERFSAAVGGWDYAAELQVSAASTIDFYREAAASSSLPLYRPMRRTLERVVLAIAEMRRQLIQFTGSRLVHGDAHPGNAIIRQSRGAQGSVLLDWGRARLGSPLEDVCSWLKSLGFWEPAAQRAHDTLMRRYLQARGLPTQFCGDFRKAYWLAGASNAMAGALRYHLALAGDPARSQRERSQSGHAAVDWLRIVYRAGACWRN